LIKIQSDSSNKQTFINLYEIRCFDGLLNVTPAEKRFSRDPQLLKDSIYRNVVDRQQRRLIFTTAFRFWLRGS